MLTNQAVGGIILSDYHSNNPTANDEVHRCVLPALETARKGIDAFFLGRQSSTTSPFGDVFFQSLVFDISSGLNVWDEDARCEEEIRHQLLTTLLSWATHYAYIIEIPSTSKERANSGVNSNSSHPHRRGRA